MLRIKNKKWRRGASVAQLVDCLTLDFDLGHDPSRGHGTQPHIGLCWAWKLFSIFCLSLPLPLSPIHTARLSLQNKNNYINDKEQKIERKKRKSKLEETFPKVETKYNTLEIGTRRKLGNLFRIPNAHITGVPESQGTESWRSEIIHKIMEL